MKGRRAYAAMTAALAVLCAVIYCGRDLFSDSPLSSRRELSGPSGVFGGADGRVYIIDGGKKSVLALNASGELEREMRAGQGSFYYASLVAEGGDGSVYVADVFYDGRGTRVAAERIFRYKPGAGRPETVYEISYGTREDAPMQYGRITDIRESDGVLTIAVKTAGGAEIRKLDIATRDVSSAYYPMPGVHFSDLGVSRDTGMPVFTTRLGEAGYVSAGGGTRILTRAAAGEIPWSVCAQGGYVYYCELNGRAVVRVSASGELRETVLRGEDVIETVRIEDGVLYATDYAGYYAGIPGGEVVYHADVPLAYRWERAGVWAAPIPAAAVAVWLAAALSRRARRSSLPRRGGSSPGGKTAARAAAAAVAVAAMSALASYITISRTLADQREEMTRQLGLFGDVLAADVDAGLLGGIDGTEDYRNGDYTAIKDSLDALTDIAYENGVYYYYGIYVTDRNVIYAVMDYEDTVTARHPFYTYGVPVYTQAFEGATVQEPREISAYGAWSFIVRPIYAGDGTVAGVLEVGVNLDGFDESSRALVRELVLTVATATATLVMLIIEAIFLLGFAERRRTRGQAGRVLDTTPLRTLLFITYMADCMQDSFVTIYADGLFEPFWGIPQGMGAALPISVQVIAAAAIAPFGAAFGRAAGMRRALMVGFAAQAAGFALCAAIPEYMALLAGKALIGAAMGVITVVCSTAAASAESAGESAETFASATAGVLAGVTVGAGVGSVAMSIGGASGAFAAGAAALTPGIALAAWCKPSRELMASRENAANLREGLEKFLADREIWGFLLLAFMPFLMALSFREYFFPLFAARSGVSEADIGRIYLVCGILVIYLGTRMTGALVSAIGERRAAALAGVLVCAALIVFALSPTFGAAAAGVMLISVAISFGYAAQSAYYSGRAAARGFGIGRAMGVYAIFDNAGQTLGPMAYAAAMLAGDRAAAGMAGAVLGGAIGAFLLVTAKKKRAFARK